MEGWKDGRMEGWKDGRMEGWKGQPHRDHRALRASFFPAAHEGVKILTLPLLSRLILETHGLARWSQRGGCIDPLMRRLRRSFRAWPRGWRIPGVPLRFTPGYLEAQLRC